MLLMIDNYDSFTYNLVRTLQELQCEIMVYRNDAISLSDISHLAPSHIILSPGPCTPNEAGISLELIRQFAGKIPIFGVCLGLQCIAQAFGSQVVRANQVAHGKSSQIYHNNEEIFVDLPNPFRAGRYHSLMVAKETLAPCLKITAWTQNAAGELDTIMAIKHRELNLEAVQFHPESILTEHGHQLLANLLNSRSANIGALQYTRLNK